MKTLKRIIRHWKTSLFGALAAALGIVSAYHNYVPSNTLWFNVAYVWSGAEALLFVGLLGLFAADHKD